MAQEGRPLQLEAQEDLWRGPQWRHLCQPRLVGPIVGPMLGHT